MTRFDSEIILVVGLRELMVMKLTEGFQRCSQSCIISSLPQNIFKLTANLILHIVRRKMNSFHAIIATWKTISIASGSSNTLDTWTDMDGLRTETRKLKRRMSLLLDLLVYSHPRSSEQAKLNSVRSF